MKNLSIAITISIFLIACGEQTATHQEPTAKIEQEDTKMVKPSAVDTDNSLAKTTAIISGNITYDDQLVLPEDAILLVRLVDYSKQENKVTTLMSESNVLEGPQPYSYELNYDKSLINERGNYLLMAAIKRGNTPILKGSGKLKLFPDADATLSLNLLEIK